MGFLQNLAYKLGGGQLFVKQNDFVKWAQKDLIDGYNESNVSELFTVLNRICTDYSRGVFEATNLEGEPVENPSSSLKMVLDKLNSGSQYMSLEDSLYRELYERLKFGVSWLWIQESGGIIGMWWNLQNQSIDKNFKSLSGNAFFSSESYNDFLEYFRYTIYGGSIKNFTAEEIQELTPIFDLGFDHRTFHPISRIEYLYLKLKMCYNANHSLVRALQRAAQLILSPQPNPSGLANVSRTNAQLKKDDGDKRAEREEFRKDIDIANGPVQLLDTPMQAVDMNVDNDRIKGFEAMDAGLKAIALAMDVPYEIFDSKTTFNNQSYILKKYINVLNNHGKILGGAIADRLGLKENGITLKLNFEELSKILMAEDGQEVAEADENTNQNQNQNGEN